MTIRELKTIVDSVSEKFLDNEVMFCYEEDDGSEVICEGVWFDIQTFYDIPWHNEFCITLCDSEKAYKNHSGRVPWSDGIFDEESEEE